MFSKIKNILIGSPLPTQQLSERRLSNFFALAAFSPDALSSIAYANQEIYLGLLVAGSAGLALAFPIGVTIALLLVIVAISYIQTIQGYPKGGGSYQVARENLGKTSGLIAAGSLLIDYVLTAAVSLTAGVEAIASAFPPLWPYKVELSLILLGAITLANLRGTQESGKIMAIPVYLFLVAYIPLILIGLFRLITGGIQPLEAVAPTASQPITLFLILHAFATGCTALTGIEAMSNGVPAFRPPEVKNAQRTLLVMAILMVILFVGSVGLTQFLAVTAHSEETILSALARKILGNSPAYYIIQIATLSILAVAANTSFAGFPRLAAILAGDNYLPRHFTSLGDRLVFTNGIYALFSATAILIILFRANSHRLIPLFAVGVFAAFTLSQLGMVKHWLKIRGKNWRTKATINGIGAAITGLTMLVVGYSKFLEGAWITILGITGFVLVFIRINNHFAEVRKQLSLHGLPPSLRPYPPQRVVIPIAGIHRGMIEAVDFARGISKDVTGIYIDFEPGSGELVKKEWERWFPDIPLEVRQSPFRSMIGPLLDFLDETDRIHNDGQLAVVVLPEFVPAHWWHRFLHNQTSVLIKNALLYRRREYGFQRAIIDIPYHLRK